MRLKRIFNMKQSSGTEIPIVASNLDLFSTDGDLCALCDHAIENKLQGILVFPIIRFIMHRFII